MSLNRNLYQVILCCFLVFSSRETQAQSLLTLVVDSSDAPIPQVQIFDENGRKWGESGNDGYARMDFKPGVYKLVFDHPDYESFRLAYLAKNQQKDTLTILLKRTARRIEAVEIKTKWTDPGPEMMRKAIAKRTYWASRLPAQRSVVYIKAFEEIKTPKLIKLPVAGEDFQKIISAPLIQANMAEIKIRRDWNPPNQIKETREAVSIRGDKSSLFFLSTLEADFNIYQNLMSLPALCPLPIVSPLSNSAILAYRFRFIESYTDTQQRRILKIKFQGRQVSNATFSGEIHVVDSAFYVAAISLNIPEHLMAEYNQMSAHIQYRLNSDSFLLIDSQRFDYTYKAGKISNIGHTEVRFDSIEVNPLFPKNHFGLELSRTEQEAYERDSTYWEQNRSIPLSANERNFVNQSDSIKRVQSSDEYLDSIERKINRITFKSLFLEGQEYRDRRKGIDMNFQPLWLMYQPWWPGGGRYLLWNRIEKTFASKQSIQLIPNVSYGALNNDLRGSVILNTLYNPYKRKRIFIQAGRDFGLINPFAAYIDLFRRDNFYQHSHLSLYHRQELVNGLYLRVRGEYSDRKDISNFRFSSSGDSLFENNVPAKFQSHTAFFGSILVSYTPFQRFISEPRQKVILGSTWPTFSVEYKKAIPGIFNSSIDYDYLEYRLEHAFPWGTAGNSELRATSGSFLSRRNINIIDYRYQRRGDDFIFTPPMYAFQTLDSTFITFKRYYEVHYRHHFNGAIINKIPLMKHLQFYESVGANILIAPERNNLVFYEMYGGVDKLIKIWKERFKIGLYYCVGYANNFSQPRSFFKVNFEFYNRSENKW
jgi:hypothetical protein